MFYFLQKVISYIFRPSSASLRAYTVAEGGDPVLKILQMQAAIDAAWRSADPKAKQLQAELFPEGKPDVETFVARLAEYARQQMSDSCKTS